jgi:hypothetical protein
MSHTKLLVLVYRAVSNYMYTLPTFFPVKIPLIDNFIMAGAEHSTDIPIGLPYLLHIDSGDNEDSLSSTLDAKMKRVSSTCLKTFPRLWTVIVTGTASWRGSFQIQKISGLSRLNSTA